MELAHLNPSWLEVIYSVVQHRGWSLCQVLKGQGTQRHVWVNTFAPWAGEKAKEVPKTVSESQLKVQQIGSTWRGPSLPRGFRSKPWCNPSIRRGRQLRLLAASPNYRPGGWRSPWSYSSPRWSKNSRGGERTALPERRGTLCAAPQPPWCHSYSQSQDVQ